MIAVLLPVGGNRTHETVPQDFLTTTALHHSDIEVLVEFDKYFDSRVVFRLKNVFGRKICRKLALRSRILFASPKVVDRPRSDSLEHFDSQNIYQIYMEK